ncbi:FAD-dependent oxidoreductase [Paramaledivibacter caminithermalis]|jgi:NADPH-dependent 2,4-dienoyl-CoA reductase/sulfur reductase-like enzyme/rhodanese-related sulfurtransferase|uniref:NADPH-dependent 2,4-dienoyl-CoA reductase, sulfur reductase n=1 Tax=Paramaledivibacter caminithermalis (strain DSM 15212 / CIP 107654 / DViRD3) TaxID=1121301 RepID=A0A1M6SGM0_PARC5|nr:FAD-dependent oxidoreductase [Paramaledivibacter caminithermalis]SHK43829.1 NADPH-dependent 2,4-dienoyl-CoA reductase, sulfur reductase [Paramaledivibacter caminithermalis DSM 15212]
MKSEKVLIIGGVAAGTKTAAKLKRENPTLDVTIITRDEYISYAGCGLPYYVGGVIEEKKELVVKTPEDFKLITGVDVLTKHEAIDIDRKNKIVKVKVLTTGEIKDFQYNKLVFATGASPFIPPIKGSHLKGVFPLRKVEDAIAIRELVDSDKVKNAVVIGGGFIGLETAENLFEKDINVTLIELAPHILPGFDEEIALYAQNYMKEKGINILTSEKAIAIKGEDKIEKVITDKREVDADLVVMSVGVRPNVELAKNMGVEIGETGAIKVNGNMETNIPDVYAVGDCAESINLITGKPAWYPMGSTANKMGRVAGININQNGEKDSLKGVLGTTVVKLFGLNAAKTGLSEMAAKKEGYNVISVLVPGNDKAHYYPGYRMIITKLIADKDSHRVLGAQVIGEGVVDKPIDIIATAITLGAKVEDLEKLDLAYAPPFSMAMSTTIVAANVLVNKLKNKIETISPVELKDRIDQVVVLDVRDEASNMISSIPGAVNIYSEELDMRVHELDKDKETVLVCKVGKNAYLSYIKLKEMGFKNLKVLEGGMTVYPYETV